MKKFSILLFALLCIGIGKGNAQYSVLLNFDSANGQWPEGSLILLGSQLYGMTFWGGAYGVGCIFRMDTNGSGYKDIHDFDGTNGEEPKGTLTLIGGKLFGTTTSGAYYGWGCVFSIDSNGSGFKKLLVFNVANGSDPCGKLTFYDNKLYGMTLTGGLYGDGLIFSIDTNGSNYKDLHDFDNTHVNGGTPFGDLTISKGILYGMTSGGGLYAGGIVFSLDTSGSGFKDMHDFQTITGAGPYGSLILSGRTLFGMTSSGGSPGGGCVFSIDTTGNSYKDVFDFNKTTGLAPNGSLILSGNVLYGMTQLGGINDSGNIFRVDTDGFGYINLFNLHGKYGFQPVFTVLTQCGNVFYGMTVKGGAKNDGVVFRYRDTNSITSLNELTQESKGVKLFPNPNNGKFVIEVKGNTRKGNIEIYNTLGEQIYSQFSNFNSPLSFDLSNYPSGIYFYRVFTETGNFVSEGKVIKE